MSTSPECRPFCFQSAEGFKICREILKNHLPFSPHDYQIRGVACILDGRDLLAVSSTGSGKTAYIYMTLFVIQAILETPQLCPSIVFPTNPALLVISPTTALEDNHVEKMKALGIRAKAVNGITKDEHQRSGVNIWDDVEEGQSIIFISPEMLTSTGFGQLIDSKIFQTRLFAIGVDEAHLLCSWGDDFRPKFHEIGFIRSRFQDHVVLFAMTATLLADPKYLSSIKSILGLHDGRYTLQRRSNARPDIQLSVRTINSTSASERFPDLDWVLQAPGKTLIFCSTILHGFKLAVYFWRSDPQGLLRNKKVQLRLCNSLNSVSYNTKTFDILSGPPTSVITIATDKLSVGVDISDFQTVIIVDPPNLNDLWQKAGRVGRNQHLISNPIAIVYIPKETMKAFVAGALNGTPVAAKKKPGKRAKAYTSELEVDATIQQVVTAGCYVKEMNRLYDNPAIDEPCSDACITCSSRNYTVAPAQCNCSKCIPEPIISAQPISKAPKTIPKISVRITKVMRIAAKKIFVNFRKELFLRADDVDTGMMPLQAFFPEYLMDAILDSFPTTLGKQALSPLVDLRTNRLRQNCSTSSIDPFLTDHPFLITSATNLLQLLWEMHCEFDLMREETKIAARDKLRAKALAARQLCPFPMNIGDDASGNKEEEEPQVLLPRFKLHINLKKGEISVTSS